MNDSNAPPGIAGRQRRARHRAALTAALLLTLALLAACGRGGLPAAPADTPAAQADAQVADAAPLITVYHAPT